MLASVVEPRDDGVDLAGVKGTGVVASGAAAAVAEATDVVSATVVRGEAEGVEDLAIAGVGLV